jgi:hypothetical protein
MIETPHHPLQPTPGALTRLCPALIIPALLKLKLKLKIES